MKRRDYIPYKDPEFDSFQSNLILQVLLHKEQWNISLAELMPVLILQLDWEAKWKIASVKVNASLGMLSQKKQSRKVYEKALRNFIQRNIYSNRDMNAGNITLCGLKPYNKNKKIIPATDRIPLLIVTQPNAHTVVIRYYHHKSAEGALHKGKTREFSYLEFAYSIDQEPAVPTDCTNQLVLTKWFTRLSIDVQQRGQVWWFYARWVNRRGVAGPWTALDSIKLW
jgi:hypothetical protein